MKLTANGHDWYPLGLDYDEDRDQRPRWRCVGCHFVSEWDDVVRGLSRVGSGRDRVTRADALTRDRRLYLVAAFVFVFAAGYSAGIGDPVLAGLATVAAGGCGRWAGHAADELGRLERHHFNPTKEKTQ